MEHGRVVLAARPRLDRARSLGDAPLHEMDLAEDPPVAAGRPSAPFLPRPLLPLQGM